VLYEVKAGLSWGRLLRSDREHTTLASLGILSVSGLGFEQSASSVRQLSPLLERIQTLGAFT